MFAILISDRTLRKIAEVPDITENDMLFLKNCAAKNRIFIRGYVTRKGDLRPWAFLPHKMFDRIFEYDPQKIQTDWDLIVRR